MAYIDIEILEHPAFLPPARRSSRILRRLRVPSSTVYKRLFLIVVMLNLVGLVLLCLEHAIRNWPVSSVSIVVATNLAMAVLVRQEAFINLMLALCGKCPLWLPLWLRHLIGKIYHLGGIHSGCGLAACFWWATCNWTLVRDHMNDEWMPYREPLFILTFLIDIFLAAILLTAIPTVRKKLHDLFELVHRYLGWATIAAFWAYLFFLVGDKSDLEHSYGMILVKSPVFWCLLIVTVALTVPWAMMKEVSVRAEKLGSNRHAIRLHFTHINVPRSAVVKLARNRLLDWHPFAAIPAATGTGFSVIVSKAGDWTNSMISSPPTKLWIRAIPTRGLLHIAPIFRSVLLVCTGSGIGPILGLTLSQPDLNCRILWSTKIPLHTYGQRVIDSVQAADPRARIIVTPGNPADREDLAVEAYYMYQETGVEAVFVISSAPTTYEVVTKLEERGVPVFGPIFDS